MNFSEEDFDKQHKEFMDGGWKEANKSDAVNLLAKAGRMLFEYKKLYKALKFRIERAQQIPLAARSLNSENDDTPRFSKKVAIAMGGELSKADLDEWELLRKFKSDRGQ